MPPEDQKEQIRSPEYWEERKRKFYAEVNFVDGIAYAKDGISIPWPIKLCLAIRDEIRDIRERYSMNKN